MESIEALAAEFRPDEGALIFCSDEQRGFRSAGGVAYTGLLRVDTMEGLLRQVWAGFQSDVPQIKGVVSHGNYSVEVILLALPLLAACEAPRGSAPLTPAPLATIRVSPTPLSPVADTAPLSTLPLAPNPATPMALNADVIVTTDKNRQTITARVGQVIDFALPPIEAQWAVNYDAEMLLPLTPPEKMSNPWPTGWFFRASASGASDVMFTSIPPPCPDATPCPPAVVLFRYTIKVDR